MRIQARAIRLPLYERTAQCFLELLLRFWNSQAETVHQLRNSLLCGCLATLGQLAAIGKRTGVAQVFGFNFSGFVAWWLWRTVYLSKLPRLEKKCRVALDWSLDLLFSKDLVQFTTARDRTNLAADYADYAERSV